jgi:hypothetical protein
VNPEPLRPNRLGGTLFVLGVAWLAAMAFLASWPDMEASQFDTLTASMADAPLAAFRCPIAIAPDEQAFVRARFRNDSDSVQSFRVQVRISEGFVSLMRQDAEQVRLEPGERKELRWSIDASDAAYRRLILARAIVYRTAGRPARERSCGVLVLGIPGVSGRLAYATGLAIGILATAVGALWWWRARRPVPGGDRRIARIAGTLAAVVAGSLAAGVTGSWLVSHLLLVLAFLVLVALLAQRTMP